MSPNLQDFFKYIIKGVWDVLLITMMIGMPVNFEREIYPQLTDLISCVKSEIENTSKDRCLWLFLVVQKEIRDGRNRRKASSNNSEEKEIRHETEQETE